MIVLAHVLEAEAPVLALSHAPLGRAMCRPLGAAGPSAQGGALLGTAILAGFHPDAVEEWRFKFHGPNIMQRSSHVLQDLTDDTEPRRRSCFGIDRGTVLSVSEQHANP
jgi:hypothetical protein